jgi:oxygen-independent coproporphyrinogen-3 oxidase
MEDHSLYLHIPFCKRRCAYCDFNTYAGMESWIPAYIAAICREMELVAGALNEKIPVGTVFLGGGTPSLLPLSAVEQIIGLASRLFNFQPGMEISLEANPGTITLDYLRGLRELGVNRLSLGVQSTDPHELELLTRLHSYEDVLKSVDWARRVGFDNLSLDLIFGLPGQTLERWQETLRQALGLRPEHISLYGLTVEEGTPLAGWAARGLVDLPDGDLAADMYELVMDRLGESGFRQYEISNWAVTDARGNLMSCRHNLQYWRGLPYLGFGAGAHGYAANWRTANVDAIPEYVWLCRQGQAQGFPRSPAIKEAHLVSQEDEVAEYMMVGLRLTEEGISARAFEKRFGQGLEMAYADQITHLGKAGLLEWIGESDRRLRLTRRGRLLGNQVFVEFI